MEGSGSPCRCPRKTRRLSESRVTLPLPARTPPKLMRQATTGRCGSHCHFHWKRTNPTMFEITASVTASLRTSLHTRFNLISPGLQCGGHTQHQGGSWPAESVQCRWLASRPSPVPALPWACHTPLGAHALSTRLTGVTSTLQGRTQAQRCQTAPWRWQSRGQPTSALDHQAQLPPNGAGGATAGRWGKFPRRASGRG